MKKIKEEIYHGISASKGISTGKPFVFRVESPSYITTSSGKLSVHKEIVGYLAAIEQSKKELTKVYGFAKEKLDEKTLSIFEAQLAFLNDTILHDKIIKRITDEKIPAYKIVCDEITLIENSLLLSRDEYLRERAADIEDIKNRVLRSLNKKKLFSKIDENSIVVSRNLTPADTILFSKRNMKGIATDLGGPNSHIAIIAKSLNVPAVVGIGDLSSKVQPGDYLIIDGYKGIVYRNPSKETLKKYRERIKSIAKLEKSFESVEKLPAETKDGKPVSLLVNLEFNKEIDYVITHTHCDVGLYRTEHLFLEKRDFPTEEEQYRQYKLLADRLYPNHVTIRTFDIGGDKILPETQREPNPYLGWRGIRICLDKPEIFLDQLKAILRASKKGNVKIMYPMIASLYEVQLAKKLLEQAKDELRTKKILFDEHIKAGIMIEIPSAIFIANELSKEADFFSVGTNDLIQYMLAVDRDSRLVSNLYQKFHPSVLRALKYLIDSANANNTHVSVCGEMAGDPLGALVLIGLGYNNLSVETHSFLRTKMLIRNVSFSLLKEVSDSILEMDDTDKIYKHIKHKYNNYIN